MAANIAAWKRALLGGDPWEGGQTATGGLLGAAPAQAAPAPAPAAPAATQSLLGADAGGHWEGYGQDRQWIPDVAQPTGFVSSGAGGALKDAQTVWGQMVAARYGNYAGDNMANTPQAVRDIAATYNGGVESIFPLVWNDGGESGQGYWAPDNIYSGVSKEFADWMDKNGLSADYGGSDGDNQKQNYTQNGKSLGSLTWGNTQGNNFDKFAEVAIPVVAGSMLGAGLYGAATGAGAGASGAALGNGAFLGEGVASGIPAWDAAAGLSSAGGAAGAAAVEFPALNEAALADALQATPEMAGSATSEYTLTPSGWVYSPSSSSVPTASAPTTTTPQADAPKEFRPSVDSQAANQQLGYGGNDIKATAPATVNMGSLGGTTATTGGLTGAANVAAQNIADATASDQLGGTAASQAGQAASSALGGAASTASDLASWLKDNPTLGRLLFSGAMGALSGAGSSGGSGSSAPRALGAPVQWTSPASALTSGLLGNGIKQVQPQALTGLLGNANDGAWRWGKQ